MKRLKAMLKGDAKSITRDPILIMSILSPVLIAFLLKYGLPFGAKLLMEKYNFDLTVHYAFILSFMLMIVSFMVGLMSGFMILDERDEGILTYYTVTPLSKSGYFIYRLSLPVIICIAMSFFVVYFSNLIPMSFDKVVFGILISAVEAPLAALFMGVFAANKVEGLALAKALGVLFIAPLAAYLIKSNWLIIAGISPTYWAPMAFVSAVQNQKVFWLYIAGGLLVNGAFAYMLFKKFDKKAF